MRRTYRSKKETGGLDPQDVIQNVDEKTTKFEAFSIKNIKHTKRELSWLNVFKHTSVSKKVRKKKLVKRLKEPDPVLAFTSKTSILTPDKSLRVNKAEELFDKLFNSSPVNNSPIVTLVQEKREKRKEKKYETRNKAIIRKYNYSSSDSSDSNKENFMNKSPNESNINEYNLLLEKEYGNSSIFFDSIDDIKNISVIKNLGKQNHSKTPNKSQFKVSTYTRSPVCSSTPFRVKYRGQSIYKYSPISSTPSANIAIKGVSMRHTLNEIATNISTNESTDIDENGVLQNIQEPEIINSDNDNSVQFVQVTNNSKTHNVQNHINDSLDDQCKEGLIDDNELKISRRSFVEEPSIILQTSERENFFGFSNDNECVQVLINKYRENARNNQDNTSVMVIEQELPSNTLGFNCKRDIFMEDSEECENVETVSVYDTCSEDESKESSSKMFLSEPVIRMEKLSQSVFDKYWQKMNIVTECDRSTCIENFESSELSVLNTENEYSDIEDNEDSNVEPRSFVTTRRRKEFIADDSFIFNLESPRNSNSSTGFEETVIKNKEDINSLQYSFDIETLVEEHENLRNSICSDIEINNVKYIHQPNTSMLKKSSFMKESKNSRNNSVNNESYHNIKNDSLVHVEDNRTESEANMTSHINKSPRNLNQSDRLNKSIKSKSGTESSSKECNIAINKKSKSPVGLCDNNYKLIPFNNHKTLCNEDVIIIEDTNENVKKTRHSKGILPSVSTNSKLTNHQPATTSSRITRHSARLSQRCDEDAFNTSEVRIAIKLEPGKRWERSLSIYRRMTTMMDGTDVSILDVESLEHKGRKYRQSVIATMEMQDFNTSLHNESIKSHRSTFVPQPIKSTIRLTRDSNVSQSSINSLTVFEDLQGFLTEDCDDTVVNLSKLSLGDPEVGGRVLEKFYDTSSRSSTARDYVLRRCNQTDALLFDECYPDASLKNCRKIGEGVYGEVFLWRAGDGRARVLKVIPIAGELHVNGEKQKNYHQIISEIVIAMELSALSAAIPDIEGHFNEGKTAETLDLHSVENATDVFNKVLAIRLVYGSYPSRLLDLWDLYDECKGSENDNPAILPPDQHYIVLELANAGQDLESYQFNNAEQAHALFQQRFCFACTDYGLQWMVAFGLAVAEQAYQFEHRDLHWGNVLIAPTDQKLITFVLRGRTHRVRTCGVKATIIDYSLSRVTLGRVLYCDLAEDESLFDAVGDYQFEVYRRMRERLGNDWKNYEPHTNVLWLHYTADKMITALRYTRTNTKIHKHYIVKLKDIESTILCHSSACEYVITDNEI